MWRVQVQLGQWQLGDFPEIIERLRKEIPEEFAHLRDLDFPAQLSNTLTLSTFHGCPPDEIERIIDWLLETYGIHCIVKLNPTLLGKEDGRRLLNETLGYTDCVIPDHAFEDDTSWPQMVDFIGRLGDKADGLGLSFFASRELAQFLDARFTVEILAIKNGALQIKIIDLLGPIDQFSSDINDGFTAVTQG